MFYDKVIHYKLLDIDTYFFVDSLSAYHWKYSSVLYQNYDMKNFLSTFLLLLIAMSCLSQKISNEKVEKLFGNKVNWSRQYAQELRTAPPAAQDKINRFNSDALRRNLTFTIGYTSVWDKPIPEITGFKPMCQHLAVLMAAK